MLVRNVPRLMKQLLPPILGFLVGYLYKSFDGSTLLITHVGSTVIGTAEITNQGNFRIETIPRY